MYEILVQYRGKQGDMLGRSDGETNDPAGTLGVVLKAIESAGNSATGAIIHIRRKTASEMDMEIDELSGIKEVM